MKKYFSQLYLFSLCSLLSAQSYAPQAGEEGTTAIHKDSEVFVNWAISCEVVRGPQQIDAPQLVYATVGNSTDAVGKANGSIVSLGDGGTAILQFEKPIRNGEGPDFAVFENGFISNATGRAFLELAFVEVSSDGINYFRFPAVNEYASDFVATTTDDPGGSGFASMDARYLHNFAGKYILNYGTPFDLADLADDALLDKNAIRFVKLIDVIGTNTIPHRTYDSLGNIAIDPFPTPFASSGFDLDAVGVIHQNESLSMNDTSLLDSRIYPNPTKDYIKVSVVDATNYILYNSIGQVIQQGKIKDQKIGLESLKNGVYYIELITSSNVYRHQVIIKK